MASMVGNPTGSVGEPGGIRAAAMAKAASVGGGTSRINPIAIERNRAEKAESQKDFRERREQREVTNKKTRESKAAQQGRAHRPGYRGNTPQNPTILT